MNHFEIDNLSFSYSGSEKAAIDKISFSVSKGEYFVICGKSGCGKTTLLRLLKPVLAAEGTNEGSILFNNTNLNDLDLKDQVSKIGFVMQNPDTQIVTDKVWHELAFGLENLGIDQKTIRMRVAEMANYFGINAWFHKKVCELSGGQKQLLNLAAVMAMQPEVLILDEPTSQLDPIASVDFLNTVKKINEELGTTIIITEHRLENVFANANRVMVMDSGKILAIDQPRAMGKILKHKNNPMFASLPTPVQIFYGVQDYGDCPLTVREGRNWIDSLLDGKGEIVKSLPQANVQEVLETSNSKSSQTPLLELRDIYFRYTKDGNDILNCLNMEISQGKIHAIMGGNGAGKSTMLKVISRIARPYSGNVYIDGKKMSKLTDAQLYQNNLSLLPQDPLALFLYKTVKEDLAEMTTDAQAIDEVVEICEIGNLLDSHPYDLSGGEAQRAALAKVLLTNPRILLLDEPTKGLDNFFKEKLARVLMQLINKGVTIVMVSHDVEFCAKNAHEVSMFFDGDIVTTNTPNNFFSKNSFYTTAANRMSRHVFDGAVTVQEVTQLCKQNL